MVKSNNKKTKSVIICQFGEGDNIIENQLHILRDFCEKNQMSFTFEKDYILESDLDELRSSPLSYLDFISNLGETIIKISAFELRMATWNYILRKEQSPQKKHLENPYQFIAGKLKKEGGGTFGQIYDELLTLLNNNSKFINNFKEILSKIKDDRDYIIHNIARDYQYKFLTSTSIVNIGFLKDLNLKLENMKTNIKNVFKDMQEAIFTKAEFEKASSEVKTEDVLSFYNKVSNSK